MLKVVFIFLFVFGTSFVSAKQCVSYLRKEQNQVSRADMVKNFSYKTIRSQAQNLAWIADAFKSQKPGLFIEISATKLKELNDVIVNDKDLVTALINLHKEMIVKEFADLLPSAQFPQISLYSDFKTLRYFIPHQAKVDAEFIKKIESHFLQINTRFFDQLVDQGLVRKEDTKEDWFHMGVARQADLASIAVRLAKAEKKKSLDLTSEKSIRSLVSEREKLLQDFKAMISKAEFSFLFDKDSGEIKLKVLELYRKNKTAVGFAEVLVKNLKAEVTVEAAQALILFLNRVDLFSPSLVVEKRTSVAIKKAEFGAFSLDFVGLGAKNLLMTLKGVIESKDINDLLIRVRNNERELTEEFNQQKEKITEVVESFFIKEPGDKYTDFSKDQEAPIIKFSGDEGIIVPHRQIRLKDMLEMQKELFKAFDHSQLRITFVHSNHKNKIETDLVSLAESVEKELKKRLVNAIENEILQQIQFNVFVTQTLGSVKPAYLLLYTSFKLSEPQKIYIKAHYRDVILEMNQRKEDSVVRLSPQEDFYAIQD